MNYRLTIALVILLALVIGITFVIVSGGDDDPDRVRVPRLFFYQVDDDDIVKVVINYGGEELTFVADDERRWHFDTPAGEDVNIERWGGVTLLLSGPQYNRQLTTGAADLSRYGLDSPQTVITVGLKGIGDVNIRLGDKTPRGNNHYAQFQDLEPIYLVDSSWGDVIARLVTEPPHIPTPTPEPEEESGEEGEAEATAEPADEEPTPAAAAS